MNRFHTFIQRIEDLGHKNKTLSPQAMKHLQHTIKKHMEEKNTNDLAEVLPFIVLYVYNESYRVAMNDFLEEFRKIIR